MKRENNWTLTSTPGADKMQVVLEGDLSIRNAAAIKKELLHAMNGLNNTEVIIRNITRIDVSVLQLLIAYQKDTVALEKKGSFRFQFPDHITDEIKMFGFAEMFTTGYGAAKQ